MSLDADIALIRSVPFLADLGEDEARLIAFGADRRRMEPGERLMREGSYSDGAYIVVSGEVILSTKARERAGEADVMLDGGTIVSPLALVSEIEHPQTAICRTPVEVLKVPRRLFRKVMEEYPHIAVALHERVATQLAAMSPELGRILDELEAGETEPDEA